jgi:predicted dehydrogenase
MKHLTRRSFLKSAAVTTAAVSWSAKSWSQIPSANDDVRVAVVGFGGRGKDHLGGLAKVKGCRITGLCDVDDAILNFQKKNWEDKGATVETNKDIRKLLESKNIDVISIATPNHWHALGAIWAVQAGKDVYVEKPVSHNVWEGRKIVEAARKYQKIVQTGTQSRSSHAIKEAVEWVNAGNLGKITVARGLCYKPRPGIGKTSGPQKVPDNIDYDLWCGPAPLLPPRRNSSKYGTIHYDWHWFWDYGCGDLGNQGIHQMDIARWFLSVNELSPRIVSLGGRLGYEDDGETPNTQIVYHDYAKAPLIFEVRGLPASKAAIKNGGWGGNDMDKFPKEKGGSVAVIVHCEGGHVLVPNYNSATAYDKEGNEVKKWSGTSDHFANFINAVRSRKHTDLNADILEGHLSSALCHTGNISYRLGKKQKQGAVREAIKANTQLTESTERMFEHLSANGVDLDTTPVQLGVALTMDPKSERFLGNDAANEMLTRPYRKPYVVPEKV